MPDSGGDALSIDSLLSALREVTDSVALSLLEELLSALSLKKRNTANINKKKLLMWYSSARYSCHQTDSSEMSLAKNRNVRLAYYLIKHYQKLLCEELRVRSPRNI